MSQTEAKPSIVSDLHHISDLIRRTVDFLPASDRQVRLLVGNDVRESLASMSSADRLRYLNQVALAITSIEIGEERGGLRSEVAS